MDFFPDALLLSFTISITQAVWDRSLQLFHVNQDFKQSRSKFLPLIFVFDVWLKVPIRFRITATRLYHVPIKNVVISKSFFVEQFSKISDVSKTERRNNCTLRSELAIVPREPGIQTRHKLFLASDFVFDVWLLIRFRSAATRL